VAAGERSAEDEHNAALNHEVRLKPDATSVTALVVSGLSRTSVVASVVVSGFSRT
jgi:hypothetical protein